ncbi:MAG TPA: hypothetical protein DCE07_01950 [Peptococcaceae bacterium]|nr:hypothetical protein [Peptococcaceae bacterium]
MNRLQKRRLSFLFCCFFCGFLILWGRLAYLQIYKGCQLAPDAVQERTRRIALSPIGNFLRSELLESKVKSLHDSACVSAVFPSFLLSSGNPGVTWLP